jgi:hypothetical protein
MLHRQSHPAGPFSPARSFHKRSISLSQRYQATLVRNKRQHLAKSPHAALIFDSATRLAPLPQRQQRRAVRRRRFVFDIEQTSARVAAVFTRVKRMPPPARLFDTL